MKVYRILIDTCKVKFRIPPRDLDWANRHRVWAYTVLSTCVATLFKSRNDAEFWAKIVLLSYTPTPPSSIHALIEEINVENDK